MSGPHDRPTEGEYGGFWATTGNNSHRTWETISSSVNLHSWRWASLALTGVERSSVTKRRETRRREANEPSRLMTSLLGTPAFNSFLFESSSFRATLRTSSLFRRSFCIPGLLEFSYTHVSNPGTHFVMAMKNTSNREGFPKDVKLSNIERMVSTTGTPDRG